MPSHAVVGAAIEYLEMVRKRKREEERAREAVAKKWTTVWDLGVDPEDAWLWEEEEEEEDKEEDEEEEKELTETFRMTIKKRRKRRGKRGGKKHKK